MEVENKLKAMGLELPAAAPPPPGRAGAVKVGNIFVRRRAHAGTDAHRKAGSGDHCGAGERGTATGWTGL